MPSNALNFLVSTSGVTTTPSSSSSPFICDKFCNLSQQTYRPARRPRPNLWECCSSSSSSRTRRKNAVAETCRVDVPDGGVLNVHVYKKTEEEDKETLSSNGNTIVRSVLLIHDFMTDKRLFQRFVNEHIVSGCQFIVPDLRGFGSSSAPKKPYSRSEDLRYVLISILKPFDEKNPKNLQKDGAEDTMDSDVQVDVIGSGMGGAVALQFALDFPNLVRSICVLGSGLPGHSWSKDALLVDITSARMVGRLLQGTDRETAKAAVIDTNKKKRASFNDADADDADADDDADDDDVTDVVRWKRLFISTNATWSDIIKSSSSSKNKMDMLITRQLLTMARDYRGFHFFYNDPLEPEPFNGDPLINHIKDIVQPVLVVVGDCDTIDFREIAYEIWERAPNRTNGIVRVENAGHFVVLEKPSVVAQHVMKFWVKHANSGVRV